MTKGETHGTIGFARTVLPSDIHAMMDETRSERDRILILLMSRTGCRIGEAVIFRTSGIKELDGVLDVPNIKRRRLADGTPVIGEKPVAVTDDVIDELRAYCASEGIHRGEYLLRGRSDGHLSVRQARNIIYKAAEGASVKLNKPGEDGVKRIWPHVLRHSYATQLLRSGWDISAIADQLGHSNITVTKLYSHLDASDRRRMIQGVTL